MSTPRPFVVDAALTAISVGFANPAAAYIADDVLPRVRVGAEQFKYDFYPPENNLTVPDTTVGRRGQVPQFELTGEQRSGSVHDRGIDFPVPNSDISEARRQQAAGNTRYDPEARAAEAGKSIVMLDREKRVAEVISNPDNYDADRREALAGTDQWSHETSDPTRQVVEACDATLIARPNIGVMGRAVWTQLRQNPRVIKALNANDGDSGVALLERLADLWELNRLLVGDTFINVKRPGQNASFERVWGNSFALLHINPVADSMNGLPTFGYTAELPLMGQNQALFTGRIDDPKAGLEGSTLIRTGEKVEETIVAPSVGYLFSNVIAPTAP